jgi:hypothetical protein
VTAGTPSRTRTVRACSPGASASPPTSSPDSVSSAMIESTSAKISDRSASDIASMAAGLL